MKLLDKVLFLHFLFIFNDGGMKKGGATFFPKYQYLANEHEEKAKEKTKTRTIWTN